MSGISGSLFFSLRGPNSYLMHSPATKCQPETTRSRNLQSMEISCLDGQWCHWPPGLAPVRYCHIDKNELFEPGNTVPSALNLESISRLRGGAIDMDGSVWVRAGLEGYLEGKWKIWRLRTTLEWFDEQSGAVALVDDKGRMKLIRFKGTWSSHGKDGFGTFELNRPQILGSMGPRFRKRPVQLVKLEFSGAQDTAAQLLTTAHCVLTWKPTSSEVRTEQVTLSQMVERISTRWRQVFAGESYGDKANVITLADPVDEWRRGEGELLHHEELDLSGSPLKLEDIVASEKVQVLRVKLTTHARTIKFRDKTFAEKVNFCCSSYDAAARDAGHSDDAVPLISPCEIYHRLWPQKKDVEPAAGEPC